MLTAKVADAWHAAGLERRDPVVAYHQVGDIGKRLLDLSDLRIALMDEAGVDVQVLSLTTPALHDLGDESVAMARRVNDALAEAVARHPGRFEAMATLPVARPGAAAAELDRCIVDLGFAGAMLCGRVARAILTIPISRRSSRSRVSAACRCSCIHGLHPTGCACLVRRQDIWRDWRRELAENGPRLMVDVMRRLCGAASADVGWSGV